MASASLHHRQAFIPTELMVVMPLFLSAFIVMVASTLAVYLYAALH